MTVNWCDVLGWQESQLANLRFIGYVYLKEGQFETARRFFEGLVLLNPTSLYDWRTLGAIYLLKNDYQKAIDVLTKALELDPSHGPTELNLAKAYLYKGEREKGIEDARKLAHHTDPVVASDAQALVLAYTGI